VSNLSNLRGDQRALHREEVLLLRSMTLEESIDQWAQLQRAFEWQLQQTASLFEQDRRAALAELQTLLHRLIE
jgi:hypothetical protein